MAYKLTQADVDKLASLRMFDALEGDTATREELAALGIQPEEPPAIVTMGGAGDPMKVEIAPPASTGGLNEYSAFRSLGMEPDVAEAAKAAINGEPLPAPDTSIEQAPPVSGSGASDMSGLLSMLAMQPQAQQYSTDPFEGLSRNQKMMLAFSAIKDAGMALQGKEGGAFEKTLGRFNDIRDIERKRQAAQAQRAMLGQIMGAQGMAGGGDINTKIQALTQAAMMGLLDPSAVSLAIAQLREQQGQQKAEEASVTGAVKGIENIAELRDMLESTDMSTGAIGWALGKVPWTDAYSARNLAKTLESNMALGALKDLKASGATLGAVSEKELELLLSDIRKLNLDQKQEYVLRDLDAIDRKYKSIIQKAYRTGDDAALDAALGGRPTWLGSVNPQNAKPQATPTLQSDDELFQEFGIE